jgi:hypothetical protein
MSILVIGVVAACQASRRATSVKDGACGTKLLNGLISTSGRPVYASLPVRGAKLPGRWSTGKRKCFFRTKFNPKGDYKAPEKQDAQAVDNQRNVPVLFLGSLPPAGRGWSANKSRGCVKSADANFGNDPIFNMRNFDESSRWIGWSKNEFSHGLSPEPLALAVPLSRA